MIKGKNLLTTNEYVTCPYCGSESEHWRYLHWRHLKLSHNKTLEDVRKDFPNHPTMTQSFDEDRLKGAQKSAQTHNENKTIHCIHCKKEMSVPKNTGNTQACSECLRKGLENPDGRTKDTANETRIKTLQEKYGNDVTNISHIEGAIEKRSKTNEERYGGTGFASKGLAIKTRQVIKELYGAENIMQTEDGKYRFIKGLQNTYGNHITNPQNLIEVRRKTSKTVIEKIRQDGHHMKGRTYSEVYNEEALKRLLEIRRKNGHEGFKKSQEMGYGPSKPQQELFNLVKQIFPDSKLEFGQNLLYEEERYYYFLDIAIPEIKINIEYDCAWTHPDPEKDKFRDEVLASFGWKTIRYFEKIPTLEELTHDINCLL